MKIKLLGFFMAIFFSACYYNSEEEILGTTTCTTTNLSFKNDILPILNSNCNGCHSKDLNLGNVILDSHAEVNKYTANGVLVAVMAHQSGYSPMPKNSAKLDDCTINKIDGWVKEGAKNN
jgi:hypothetical protein